MLSIPSSFDKSFIVPTPFTPFEEFGVIFFLNHSPELIFYYGHGVRRKVTVDARSVLRLRKVHDERKINLWLVETRRGRVFLVSGLLKKKKLFRE